MTEYYPAPHKNNLFLDIRFVLYAGILLLTGGLSVIIYKHIDQIGHLAIILAMSLACVSCFFYCIKHILPFNRNKVESQGVLYDYILLLGSILLVTLIGYVQYQYHVFGEEWKLASFIPMVLLFLIAYRFDHQGILSMAIFNLAGFLGIVINEEIFSEKGLLNNKTTLITAVLLGFFLILASWITKLYRFKFHFEKVYHFIGSHFFLLCCLNALSEFYPNYWYWAILYACGVGYQYWKAEYEKSFYEIVVTLLYGYILISFLFVDMLKRASESLVYMQFASLYFLVSGILLIVAHVHFFNKYRKYAGV